MKAWIHLLCFSLVLTIAAVPAAAQQTGAVEAYKQHVAAGSSLFKRGRYAEARRQFERAYEIHKDPQLLFNIASTYRREGNTPKAIAYYHRFLRVAPADHPRVKLAERTIVKLQTDGVPKPAPPTVVPPKKITQTKPAGRTLRRTGIGAFALGGLGLTVGLIEGLRARSISSQLSHLPAGTMWNDAQQARHREGTTANTRAIVFSLVGGATAVTGVVLYYLGRNQARPAETRRTQLIPILRERTATLVLVGRF